MENYKNEISLRQCPNTGKASISCLTQLINSLVADCNDATARYTLG